MNYRICRRCGTANQPDYIFCKNCGTPLEGDNPVSQPVYGNTGYGNACQQQYAVDNIDGVRVDDVALFLGKDRAKYLPKFMRMEISGSSISVNWLVMFMCLFVSPLFAAFWLMQKRMNKAGIALFIIASAIQGAYLYFTFDAVMELMKSSSMSDMSIPNFSALLNAALESKPIAGVLANLYNVTSLAIGIGCGLFVNSAYKSHAVKQIKSIVALNEQEYRSELIRRGGTRNTLWVVLLVLTLVSLFAMSAFYSMSAIV